MTLQERKQVVERPRTPGDHKRPLGTDRSGAQLCRAKAQEPRLRCDVSCVTCVVHDILLPKELKATRWLFFLNEEGWRFRRFAPPLPLLPCLPTCRLPV